VLTKWVTSYNRANVDSVEHEHHLAQRQLRWIGHVIRMPSNQLRRRRLMYGELKGDGERSRSTFSQLLQATYDMSSTSDGHLTSARFQSLTWKRQPLMDHTGGILVNLLSILNTAIEEAAEQQRARGHRVHKVTSDGPKCP